MSVGNTASGFYDCNIWILLTHWVNLNVIKAVDSFTLYHSFWLSGSGSQKQNETLGFPYGSSNLQDKRGLGQFLKET